MSADWTRFVVTVGGMGASLRSPPWPGPDARV
jgi:hypothetical protein